MTNSIVVPDTFKDRMAPVFAGAAASDDLSGGITGGYGLIKYRGKVWSVQYQGSNTPLMRLDGDGPRASLDLVIVKANGLLSKTWYEGGWDENNSNPPDCASANGVFPDAGVAKKQSNVCATCPKNAWGSDPKGGRGKACQDHRRLAVVPLSDLRLEMYGGPLLLRCPAASLQDLAAFDSRYKGMGYPYFTMAIKIGFDPQESFPKFTFNAIRPLTNDEGAIIMAHRGSAETARVVSEASAPAQAAAAPASEPAFAEGIPADAIKPQVQVPPAKPAPVVQPEASPTTTVGAGGFGAVRPSTVAPTNGGAPVVAQPAKPAVQMTGFGGVTSQGTQVASPAKADPAAAAPVTPGVVSAFEGSIDDRLNALFGE